MKRLAYTFRDGPHFLRHYQDDGVRERLFLPGEVEVGAGQQLDLEIGFRDSGFTFTTTAEVLARRLRGGGDALGPGALVALVQAHGQRLILAHARGRAIDYHQRSDPRVACAFPVSVRRRQGRVTGEAVDFSPGGLLLAGGPEVEVGEALELRLHPAGSALGLGVLGQVRWVQTFPEAACGVSLRTPARGVQRRINRLYVRLLRGVRR